MSTLRDGVAQAGQEGCRCLDWFLCLKNWPVRKQSL